MTLSFFTVVKKVIQKGHDVEITRRRSVALCNVTACTTVELHEVETSEAADNQAASEGYPELLRGCGSTHP